MEQFSEEFSDWISSKIPRGNDGWRIFGRVDELIRAISKRIFRITTKNIQKITEQVLQEIKKLSKWFLKIYIPQLNSGCDYWPTSRENAWKIPPKYAEDFTISGDKYLEEFLWLSQPVLC